jgi:hypothetical protein
MQFSRAKIFLHGNLLKRCKIQVIVRAIKLNMSGVQFAYDNIQLEK